MFPCSCAYMYLDMKEDARTHILLYNTKQLFKTFYPDSLTKKTQVITLETYFALYCSCHVFALSNVKQYTF